MTPAPYGGNNSVAPTDASASSSFDGRGFAYADGRGRGGGDDDDDGFYDDRDPPRRTPDPNSDFDVYVNGHDDGGASPVVNNNNNTRKSSVTGRTHGVRGPVDPDDRYDRNTRCMAKSLLTFTVLSVAGFLTWKYGLDEPTNWDETQEGFQDIWEAAGDQWKKWDLGNFTDVLDGLDGLDFADLLGGDPMLGDNTTINWDNDYVESGDGGLHLTLQNALDDTWQSEFEMAVSDWRESDALRLTTERVAVDYDCNMVEGVMVVCNANFGATGWVGINENSILRGVIIASVAKMNEYYLRNADFDHRRFTMCHEIGHGFGLPHTDENPHNTNLGNCLDYTDTPSTNLMPGEVNMAKLREMYLTRRLTRVEEDGTVIETTQLIRR